MGTATKDMYSLTMPTSRVCAVEYWSKDLADAFDAHEKVAYDSGDEDEIAWTDALNELMTGLAVDYIKDTKKYLERSYERLWDESAFYSGNFRGALKITGASSFSSDPFGAAVDFDEDWFLTPKTLTSLKPRRVSRQWVRHGKNHSGYDLMSKTYYYPAGQKVQITGEDYRERVPPSPFVMSYLEELDADERAKAGVD